MPSNLDGFYERILSKIPPEDFALASRVLRWLVCSVRPLTLAELTEAIAISSTLTKMDRSTLLNHPEDILDICGGLVTLDETTNIVGLAHFSVKEYLTSPRIATSAPNVVAGYAIDVEGTHVLLAKCCLRYLAFKDFEVGACVHEHDYKERVAEYAFLSYAAENWPAHAQHYAHGQNDTMFLALMDVLLDPFATEGNLLAWAQARHTEGELGKWERYKGCGHIQTLLKNERDEIEALVRDPWALVGCGCFGGGSGGGGGPGAAV